MLIWYGLKMVLLIVAFAGFRLAEARQVTPALPLWNPGQEQSNKTDWLIQSAGYTAGIYQTADRQDIFDGTWDQTPSMGWGFVPPHQIPGRLTGGRPRTTF